eukprot:gene13047-9340_t
MAETCSHQDPTRSKVSSTAHLVAYARSLEAQVYKENKLFDDPFAGALAGEVGERSQSAMGDRTPAQKKHFLDSISVRTRTIDDYVLESIQEHGVDQVVVLGAGLDTRPWRLQPSGIAGGGDKVHYFEIDFDEIFSYKLNALGGLGAQPHPLIEYHSVAADMSLGDVWPTILQQHGFDVHRRSLWILEGFCNYLTENELRAVMRTVSSLSPEGSRLMATMVTAAATHLQFWLHRFWPDSALAFFQSCEVVPTPSSASTTAPLAWQGREDDVEDLATSLGRQSAAGEERRGYFIARVELTHRS